MGKIKYTEEEFLKEVDTLYNGSIEVVGRYKGMAQPLLCKDKYGIMSLKRADQMLRCKPSIKVALNKTEYFMNQFREAFPENASQLQPASEYVKAKEKMLFNTKYGIVSALPDTLMAGHMPGIQSAIDRKSYFKNQLLEIYGDKYDFEITSTDRHNGRVTLICPIHGPQSIDSDTIFLGGGCPMCNHGWEKSNTFYLIHLYDDDESFYKLGISYRKDGGEIRRYGDYRALKYNIEEIITVDYDDFLKARAIETELKQIIKPFLYTPKRWENNTSTECFTTNIIPTLLDKINYDIVSTSNESQSSCLDNGSELTTPNEEN